MKNAKILFFAARRKPQQWIAFRSMAVMAITSVLAIISLPTVVHSADLAPSGTVGTLTVKVNVVGGAKYKAHPRAGYDAREWKVKNSGQFSIRLKAMEPAGDDSPENQAKADAARGAYQQAITEKDQEVIDKWEAKVDACNGNEACENKVQTQMFSDPQYQRIIMKMQGAAPGVLEAGRGVDTSLVQQLWSSDPAEPSPASGTLKFDVEEKEFGGVDTAGGGKVDTTCRYSDVVKIKPGSPESKVGAVVRINAKTSKYEIRIPAEEFAARVTVSCRNSKTGAHSPSKSQQQLRLIGKKPGRGAKDFNHLLTFRGPIGSARSPQFSGKQTVTTNWIEGDGSQPVPLKVTLEWSFSAGGR